MGVGKDPKVAVDRRPGDARIPCEPRHGQESGEARKIADQRFSLNFFLEIHLHVRLEGLPPVGSRPNHGQAAVAKHLGNVEIMA